MLLAYIALSCRIVFLGLERILVKKLGTDADSISTAFIFIGLSPFFPFSLQRLYISKAAFDNPSSTRDSKLIQIRV